MFQLDRRQFLLGSAAAGALAATGCQSWRPESASARALRLYDQIFNAMLEASPELATGLGLDTGARTHLRHRLGDVSAAGKMGAYRPMIDALPRLRSIQRNGLPPQEMAWLDTVTWVGERVAAFEQYPYGGIGGYSYPVPFVLTQLTGSYQDVPDFLDSQHKIETRDDADAYLHRLEAFARNVDHEVDHARSDAGRGVVPPAFILDKALAQTRNLRGEAARESGLVQSLVRRTREKNVPGDWATAATAVVEGRLYPALDRQLAVLTELRRGAGTAAGVSRLPNGESFYANALRFHTSTTLTPDEAHRIGLSQVAELTAQADPLLRAEGLTTGAVGNRLDELGKQERFLYANSDSGRQQLLADLNRQMEAVKARMPEVFATIPRSPMEVKRVPPAIELGAPRGYAQGPSLDGSRPGAYYINLQDTRIWPKWALPTLTYHESIPGHLWQGSIVIENERIPLLLRNIGIPAYGEGWGLYAEQLADEVGMYRDFPTGRIGMLQSFLYRAARIVVDTGLHAQGWSRERAIGYFAENVGLNPIAAQSEIDRYIVWPGQAASYKLGHNEFVRLREQARSRLGPRFDIKSFHDAVLLNGDMPLEVLGTVVAEWTEQRLRG
ncbi:DUF885 domain-containing protein [Allosphingosinicella sp.]|jgi:uncharacterized protein (DUF885 family)|uniref:DUF885 domain-containing protein n=1 Tax=Allosphingosinicella sp. TaxID=2823234 RepID=UPI002EFABA0E